MARHDHATFARAAARDARVRWLGVPHADRLLAEYPAHARPIFTLLRFQGCRTQEALQLQLANVDLDRRTIYFERTKNGAPRTVKMHDRVVVAVTALLALRGNPQIGHLFLNSRGRPYADTRDYKWPGGNPLRSVHDTAFAKAVKAGVRPNGGDDFTIHDWRHNWASWMVMEGADIETVKRLGGWKDLRSLARYMAVSTDHMDAAIARLR